MTYAPSKLLEVRTYLKPLTGLPDKDLGIVGDAAHVGGYHHGWDQRRIIDGVLRDYSWLESARDSNHKTNAARAFDVGWFDRTINGRRRTLTQFNLWLVGELNAGAPDTLDIREFIYTPDGLTVKRWDREGKRTTGDPSHLRHSHISYYADAETRDKVGLFRRFFEGNPTIPPGSGSEGDDMFTVYHEATLNGTSERVAQVQSSLEALRAAEETRAATMLAAIQALSSAGGVDGAPIVAAIVAEGDKTRALVEQRHAEEIAALNRQAAAQIAALQAQIDELRSAAMEDEMDRQSMPTRTAVMNVELPPMQADM